MSEITKDNKVTITLEEYMQFQELLEHEKEVKMISHSKLNAEGEDEFIGTTINWKSDGKCWLALASKLESAGHKHAAIARKARRLEEYIKRHSNWRKIPFYRRWITYEPQLVEGRDG